MSDIVERLRACHGIPAGDPDCCCAEAADEIERLRERLKGSDMLAHVRGEQIERLRAALAKSLDSGSEAPIDVDRWLVLIEQRDKLLAALKEIASHDTGMRPDFSVGAKQAATARRALEGK